MRTIEMRMIITTIINKKITMTSEKAETIITSYLDDVSNHDVYLIIKNFSIRHHTDNDFQ